jgi:divalent metal cation (Fe/Co/Zn/Cd) transporter
MKDLSAVDGAGSALSRGERKRLYRHASLLALVTILYNCAEGLVSVFFGFEDETIALLGFGLDSFVEVLSGIGIWHMVRRVLRGETENVDGFEKTALRVTGTAFYLLAGGLAATAVAQLAGRHAPESTVWGIVVASVSIATMWLLMDRKRRVGKKLGSEAILADANCTKTCLILSAVLLFASAGYELSGVRHLDTAGAVFIAWFALKEGKEAFGKARGETCRCE